MPKAPEQPGDPTGVDPQQVWARPGTATLPPPTLQAPPALPHAAPAPLVDDPTAPSRRRVKLTSVLVAIALLLGIAAAVMSAIKLTAATPTATTTTMTAPPPTYSPQEMAAARKEACEASLVADGPITAAQQQFAATAGERGSDRYRQMLANLQTVVMVETNFMRSHLKPATPKDVADATEENINALIAMVDANTREVPDAEANKVIERVNAAGAQLNKICGD